MKGSAIKGASAPRHSRMTKVEDGGAGVDIYSHKSFAAMSRACVHSVKSDDEFVQSRTCLSAFCSVPLLFLITEHHSPLLEVWIPHRHMI
jgi:hypothetical protein